MRLPFFCTQVLLFLAIIGPSNAFDPGTVDAKTRSKWTESTRPQGWNLLLKSESGTWCLTQLNSCTTLCGEGGKTLQNNCDSVSNSVVHDHYQSSTVIALSTLSLRLILLLIPGRRRLTVPAFAATGLFQTYHYTKILFPRLNASRIAAQRVPRLQAVSRAAVVVHLNRATSNLLLRQILALEASLCHFLLPGRALLRMYVQRISQFVA